MIIDFSDSFISPAEQSDLSLKLKELTAKKSISIYFPHQEFNNLYLTELFLIIKNFMLTLPESQKVNFLQPAFQKKDIQTNQACLLNFSNAPILNKQEALNFSHLGDKLWLEKFQLQQKLQDKTISTFEIYGFSPFILAQGSNTQSLETDLIIEKITSLLGILTEDQF